MKRLSRLVDRLADLAGDGARVEELRSHLAQLEDGPGLGPGDVASVAVLAARYQLARAVRDLPLWLAGLAVGFPFLLLLGFTYETHFFAWDMVDRTPAAADARFWKRAIDVVTVIGLLAALVAGRRTVEHVRNGRMVAPAALGVALVIAASQTDLFIEHTPPFRDGALRESHINEVSLRSVGLYAAFALIPVLFLAFDRLLTTLGRHRRPTPPVTDSQGPIDARAIAAVALPLTVYLIPFLWIIPFIGLVWSARPFGFRDRVAATVVFAGPQMALAGWALWVDDNIDDIQPLLLVGALVAMAAMWVRLAYLALGPLRGASVPISTDNLSSPGR